MKHPLIKIAPVILAAMAPINGASAHVIYYDLFNNTTTQITHSATSTSYSGGDIVAGNYGWADATDIDWGDSHKASWIKFDIANTNGAWVSINVAGDGINQYTNNDPNNPSRLGNLKPGFSLYQGQVPYLSHDEATVGLSAQAGKEGAWQALSDTTMGNDDGDINTIQLLAYAGSRNSAASSVSLGNIFLGQGSYSLAIGGTCYDQNLCVGAFSPNHPDAEEIARGYTVNISVSSTAPAAVPLPAAAWLMMSGLFGVLGLKKRKLSNQLTY